MRALERLTRTISAGLGSVTADTLDLQAFNIDLIWFSDFKYVSGINNESLPNLLET
jgi:hypothetical protein